MSPALAIAATAALFIVLLVPLALAAWKPGAVASAVVVYSALLSLVLGYQSGLFSQTDVPVVKDADILSSRLSSAQCAEILSLLDRAGAIIDRTRPPSLVVAKDAWSQLPEAAREPVMECVQRNWPKGAGPAEVEERAI